MIRNCSILHQKLRPIHFYASLTPISGLTRVSRRVGYHEESWRCVGGWYVPLATWFLGCSWWTIPEDKHLSVLFTRELEEFLSTLWKARHIPLLSWFIWSWSVNFILLRQSCITSANSSAFQLRPSSCSAPHSFILPHV